MNCINVCIFWDLVGVGYFKISAVFPQLGVLQLSLRGSNCSPKQPVACPGLREPRVPRGMLNRVPRGSRAWFPEPKCQKNPNVLGVAQLSNKKLWHCSFVKTNLGFQGGDRYSFCVESGSGVEINQKPKPGSKTTTKTSLFKRFNKNAFCFEFPKVYPTQLFRQNPNPTSNLLKSFKQIQKT